MRVFAAYKEGKLLGAHSEFNRRKTVYYDIDKNGAGTYVVRQFLIDRKIVKNYRFKGCVNIGDSGKNEYVDIKELEKSIIWQEDWCVFRIGAEPIRKCHVSDEVEE